MYDKYLLENIEIYLDKSGWKQHTTTYNGLYAYLNDKFPNIKIIFPKTIKLPDFDNRMDDIINILSLLRNEEKSMLINHLIRFNYDFHNYRVLGEFIPSLPLKLAENIITSMQNLIYQTVHYEFDQMKDYFKELSLSKTEVTSKYLDECKFGHTWKGSFGLTVETPLNLKSIGIFNDNVPNFERKISQKIYDGIKVIKKAEELKDDSYIIDNVEKGFSGKMLKELLEIGNSIDYSTIEYSTSWAPSLPPEGGYLENNRFELTKITFTILEKAVSKLKVEDEPIEILFNGFPVGLKSNKEQLLNNELLGERFIFVRGWNEFTKEVTLKMELELSDYMKALQAHEQHEDVQVRCLVKKKTKGWEVIKVLEFMVNP